ncbi:hypothetical protein BVY01_03330 [bacterium I07]|nr:hypothetical protein BVY01_03330 [bacterium I07]
MEKERGHFSRLGFILAAAGSAVGLGNLWKFSYITYENQGGSFVLVYLLAVVLVGFPIMMAEIIVGRATQKSPVGAFLKLGYPLWSLIGWLGISAGFLILSYYSVVAGWTVQYFIKCIGWSLQGFTDTSASLGDGFNSFLANGWLQVLFHFCFMAVSVSVVVFGIQKGIERITRIIMPMLFGILFILLITSVFTPGFKRAITFIFTPTKIGPDGLLEAVGQAFFSLSLGMGALITYGSYMTKKESVPKAAGMVCLMDTMIAIFACIIMFSIIFTVPGIEFSRSTGIMFNTLPEMFYRYMPGGVLLAPLFFLLVIFAALTSTISLLEVVVSFFIDQLSWSRITATISVGAAIFSFGILSALSFGSVPALSSWQPFGDKSQGVFDTFDYLATNWFLPVGGILIAIFVGWILKNHWTKQELEEGHGPVPYHHVWKILLRFVAPLTVGWIIYSVIFMGKAYN